LQVCTTNGTPVDEIDGRFAMVDTVRKLSRADQNEAQLQPMRLELF
jgi:hypothetical protein